MTRPIQPMPDETIFASAAKASEVSPFPDLPRGWGISFDESEGIPPMEWFNALFKRIDSHIQYLMQHGIPEWSNTQYYPKNALIQHQGVFYRALTDNQEASPAQHQERWQRFEMQPLDLTAFSQAVATALSGLNQDILYHTRRLENLETAVKQLATLQFIDFDFPRRPEDNTRNRL